jgi:hypothetical protein
MTPYRDIRDRVREPCGGLPRQFSHYEGLYRHLLVAS